MAPLTRASDRRKPSRKVIMNVLSATVSADHSDTSIVRRNRLCALAPRARLCRKAPAGLLGLRDETEHSRMNTLRHNKPGYEGVDTPTFINTRSNSPQFVVINNSVSSYSDDHEGLRPGPAPSRPGTPELWTHAASYTRELTPEQAFGSPAEPGDQKSPSAMTKGPAPILHHFVAYNPVEQNPPCNTLYVGNLPIDTSEEILKAVFSKQLGYKRLCFRTKQNGPMCFVEFEHISCARRALHDLYGHRLHDRHNGGIRLSFSKNPLGVRSISPEMARGGNTMTKTRQKNRQRRAGITLKAESLIQAPARGTIDADGSVNIGLRLSYKVPKKARASSEKDQWRRPRLEVHPAAIPSTIDLMRQTDSWMANGELTPESLSQLSHHHRESSPSSLGSTGPASPYSQNTSNPNIAVTDSVGDGYHGLPSCEDFNYHLTKSLSDSFFANYPNYVPDAAANPGVRVVPRPTYKVTKPTALSLGQQIRLAGQRAGFKPADDVGARLRWR